MGQSVIVSKKKHGLGLIGLDLIVMKIVRLLMGSGEMGKKEETWFGLDCDEYCEIVNGSGEIGKKNKKKKKHEEEREDEDKRLNSGQICDGNNKNDAIVQESGTLQGSNEIGKKKKNKHKEGREDKNLNDGLVFYDAQRRKILDRSSKECDEERESCSGVVVSGKDIKEIKLCIEIFCRGWDS